MISNRCARKSLVTNCNSIISKNYLRFLVDSNDAISKASRVIRILAPEMYNTVFSYYAAVLGGIIPEELHV